MFKNKSDNLKLLQGFNLKKSRIPLFLDFKVKSWRKTNKQKIIDKIKSNLNKKICIRSAYVLEDKKNQSLAGKFESFLNIENNSKNISKYVEKIILQYKKYDASNVQNSKIFIQNRIYRKIEEIESWQEVLDVIYQSVLPYEKDLIRKITNEDVVQFDDLFNMIVM